MLAKGAGCPPAAPMLPAELPAEDAAESRVRCVPRMASAAESTTCSAGHGMSATLEIFHYSHDLCEASRRTPKIPNKLAILPGKCSLWLTSNT